ncbi:HNH endonuclease [Leisingera methylohalidivorans]|uniref:Endonuclease n=1 Tax=Leisingera methylohalidivorans DSM 14336 TaxID=999552 RepID=V9VP38_9RHOB|nr:HNH endonuclease signature motif containing protein [Leisingera methylohalidivorans]AHD00456.1 endonuclease [Leisingera methylohalidivorans DSM 14336]
MSRPVKEWIGKTDTTPAPTRVKARIVMAQDGICACGCGAKLGASGEAIEFDHEDALILGGENREANLRALRRPCHRVKTNQDVAQKSVEARKRAKHLGLHQPKSALPGSRNTKWKKKISGEVVPR